MTGDGPPGDVVAPVRQLLVQRLHDDAVLPRRSHPGDAGLDLSASADVAFEPGERAAVPTGLVVAIPHGHVGLVHPRSGLALRRGLTVLNAPGTIDAGYRGELKVLLVNLDAAPVRVRRGERIAQLVVQAVALPEVVEVDDVASEQTDRAAGGFGSTGRF